ncbi:hypothetical protein ACIQ7D_17860 [Streptomyces sp. NPDC096310]|uniref:hypothetical protein n=1 Tax=Streptomyces sp. NPDC096310 TaxID=3366082 RepID=UPI003802C428
MPNRDPRKPMAEWVARVTAAKNEADRNGGDPVIDQDLADVRELERAVSDHVTGSFTARIAARVPGTR